MRLEEQKQKRELERLQVKREMRAARARLEVYKQVAKQKGIIQADDCSNNKVRENGFPTTIHNSNVAQHSHPEVSSLTQAF